MKQKRQAKTLLLRTHQSLRKPRPATSTQAGASAAEASGRDKAPTEEEEEKEEEEDVDIDAVTRANTVANAATSTAIQKGKG